MFVTFRVIMISLYSKFVYYLNKTIDVKKHVFVHCKIPTH